MAVTLLLGALFVDAASAQDTSPAADLCQRAWTAAEWETVAKECAHVAAEDDTTASYHVQEFVTGGASSSANSQQLTDTVGPEYLVAGEAWTRVAVGEGHLNRDEAFQKARANALSDLSEARHFGSPDTVQKAAAISQLISSETFLADAPASSLLTQLPL